MSSDPWTSFLDWLATVLVPAWGELISLLPVVLVGSLVGPFVTIIVAMWVWHLVKRRRGRLVRGEAQPAAAALDTAGQPDFPPNVPYCERHALVFSPRARRCTIDGDPLHVTCPVDRTVRNAEIDTCSACGTRFTLGATSGSGVVLLSDGPPEGGAAIA
ncbi:MAG TPA: hypothetical protein VK987_07215 [Anaerolineae bacterium]|jgi:hypothetical protein|nr:hypothetical protein [Anaerolineae bacterium]